MLIYSPDITSRLRYMVAITGQLITGQPARLTDDRDEFLSYQSIRINYSHSRISERECQIIPSGLLHETGIQVQPIEVLKRDDDVFFFATPGNYHFDIFSAAFYLITRYEEYLPFSPDLYGRYPHTSSLAFREGFLNHALVNRWFNSFSSALGKLFECSIDNNNQFSFFPTYDIDEAWAYRHKSITRKAGASLRTILQGNFRELKERVTTALGKNTDPFDSHDIIIEYAKRTKQTPLVFFLVASKNGKFDKHNLPSEKKLQGLIRKYDKVLATGIHPSWQSGDRPELITEELKTLEAITGKTISKSRQHFIRFTIPHSYRQLINAGITEDYSMGYGSINGFRASIATPFYWYDLEKEQQTSLLLYPFCYMDANSYYEEQLTPEKALQEMQYYADECRKVNGTMITIWHNTFLGSSAKFKGWREIYEQFMEQLNTER